MNQIHSFHVKIALGNKISHLSQERWLFFGGFQQTIAHSAVGVPQKLEKGLVGLIQVEAFAGDEGHPLPWDILLAQREVDNPVRGSQRH